MENSCVLSNNAVCVNELPCHLCVPAGLINKRQIEGDLPPQVHLIVRYALSERWASSGTVYIFMCGACASNIPPESVQAVRAPSGNNVWPNVWGPAGVLLYLDCTCSPGNCHGVPSTSTRRRIPEITMLNKVDASSWNTKANKNKNKKPFTCRTSACRFATYFWDAMWKKVRPIHRLYRGLSGWVWKAWTYWPEGKKTKLFFKMYQIVEGVSSEQQQCKEPEHKEHVKIVCILLSKCAE